MVTFRRKSRLFRSWASSRSLGAYSIVNTKRPFTSSFNFHKVCHASDCVLWHRLPKAYHKQQLLHIPSSTSEVCHRVSQPASHVVQGSIRHVVNGAQALQMIGGSPRWGWLTVGRPPLSTAWVGGLGWLLQSVWPLSCRAGPTQCNRYIVGPAEVRVWGVFSGCINLLVCFKKAAVLFCARSEREERFVHLQ